MLRSALHSFGVECDRMFFAKYESFLAYLTIFAFGCEHGVAMHGELPLSYSLLM